jgi:hypothetical protein
MKDYKTTMASLTIAGLMAVAVPASAKVVLRPGPKPTKIEPGRLPFTFSRAPTIRASFGRDEPFLEGEISYGYGGRVVTPIVRGSDAVAPVGSPAYGVPVRTSNATTDELVWCAVTRKNGAEKIGAVCLFNEGLSFGGNDSLMTTSGYISDNGPYGGGEIVSAPFDLGAPVRVRYYVQNLGKIARVKAQIWVGDVMANQWGYIFGDIARGSQPAERLFSVGGGVIGISSDPAAKGHYVLRVVAPLKPDGGAPLVEMRNDSRIMEK